VIRRTTDRPVGLGLLMVLLIGPVQPISQVLLMVLLMVLGYKKPLAWRGVSARSRAARAQPRLPDKYEDAALEQPACRHGPVSVRARTCVSTCRWVTAVRPT